MIARILPATTERRARVAAQDALRVDFAAIPYRPTRSSRPVPPPLTGDGSNGSGPDSPEAA